MSRAFRITFAMLALSAFVLVLAFSSQITDADQSFSGNVVLHSDTTVPDGTDSEFASGTVVDLGGYTLDLGSGNKVKVLGDVTFTGSGRIILGSGTSLVFPTAEFPGADESVTAEIGGMLSVSHTGSTHLAQTAGSIHVNYARTVSDLKVVYASSGHVRIAGADRMDAVYGYTCNAHKQIISLMTDSSYTFEEMLRNLKPTDYLSVEAAFGTMSLEDRVMNAGEYTYTKTTLVSASTGKALSLRLSVTGFELGSIDVDSVSYEEGSSTSVVKTVTTVTGMTEPQLSFGASALSLSVSAEEIRRTKTGGSGCYDIAFHKTRFSMSATIAVDPSAEDIPSMIGIKRSVISSEADYVTVAAEKQPLRLDYVKIDAVFESGVFTELNISGSYGGTRLEIRATGFDLDVTKKDSGRADVDLTISTISMVSGAYRITVAGVSADIDDLDVDVLAQRLSANGEIRPQDILDASEKATLKASRVTIDSEYTATLDGVTMTLRRDGGSNCMTLILGAVGGTIASDGYELAMNLSPTQIDVRSDCSLSVAGDALFRKYSFTGDARAEFAITTERASVAMTTGSGKGLSVTTLAIEPVSGTTSFTFDMEYVLSSDDLVLSSTLDMGSASVTVSNSTTFEGYDDPATVSLVMKGLKGNAEMHTCASGSDTEVKADMDIRADAVIDLSYFGIVSYVVSDGTSLRMTSASFRVSGYDCRENGIVGMIGAVTDHDIRMDISATLESAYTSLKTDKAEINRYTDIGIDIGGAVIDIRHDDAFRLAVKSLRITATDSEGRSVDKSYSNFTYVKDLSPETVRNDVPYMVLTGICIAVTSSAWTLIISKMMARRRDR